MQPRGRYGLRSSVGANSPAWPADPNALPVDANNPHAPDPSAPRARRGTRLAWLVVGAWLASAGVSFWFFELHPLRPFDTAALDAADTARIAREAEDWLRTVPAEGSAGAPYPATVVHVYQPGCDCNRYTDPHAERIQADYAPLGVRFLRVDRTKLAAAAHAHSIAATPAALVFDATGHLVYFGPYSDAAWCGASGGLVERALDRTLHGAQPAFMHVNVRGCFCGGQPT